METAKMATSNRCSSSTELGNGPCQIHNEESTITTSSIASPRRNRALSDPHRDGFAVSSTKKQDRRFTWVQETQLERMPIRAFRVDSPRDAQPQNWQDIAFLEVGKPLAETNHHVFSAMSTAHNHDSQAPFEPTAHIDSLETLQNPINPTISPSLNNFGLQASKTVLSPEILPSHDPTISTSTTENDQDSQATDVGSIITTSTSPIVFTPSESIQSPAQSTDGLEPSLDTTNDNDAVFDFDPDLTAEGTNFLSPSVPKIRREFGSPSEDSFNLPPSFYEPPAEFDSFDRHFVEDSRLSASPLEEDSPLDSFHGLRDIRKVSSSPFLHRSFTAPEKSFMTLQERRLTLRNRHLNASPVMSSVKFDDRPIPNSKKIAKATGHGPFATISYPSKLSSPRKGLNGLMSAFDSPENTSKSRSPLSDRVPNLTQSSFSSIQASLQHRRSPSAENSSYIEHLERQVADLTTRLQSYTNPSSEKSHAAVVQRLNNKVRGLENQVAEWENVFDDRVKEAEKTHAEIERIQLNQLKALREQIQSIDQANVGLEEEIENERKENAALRLELTERKALALDNAKLAEALKKTFATIESLEQEAKEAEILQMNNVDTTISSSTFTRLSDIITADIDDGEDFKDEEDDSVALPETSALGSPYSSPDSISVPNTPGEDGKRGLRRSNTNRARKMRKFPRGLPGPTHLLLSPAAESASSSSFSRPGSAEYFSSTDYGKNGNRWSFPKETTVPESGSLFAELAKAQDEYASGDEMEEPVSRSLDDDDFVPSSPTDTETSIESSDSCATCNSSSSTNSVGLGYLLYAPFRLTSTVITHVGYGILHPRKAVREATSKAVATFVELGNIDAGDGVEITIDVPAASDFRARDSFRLYQLDETTASNSISARQSRRELMSRAVDVLVKKEDATARPFETSPRSSRQHHLANTVNQLCADDNSTPKPHRIAAIEPTSSSRAEQRLHQAPVGSQSQNLTSPEILRGLHINTDITPKRPFLPVRPIASMQSSTTHNRRISLPPPYSEHASTARSSYFRNRRQGSTLSSSSVDEDLDTSLVIPESELARVLKNDISNGSLMRAMGLYKESPIVLWTKLLLSFVITMFVAVRDGPEVALEYTGLRKARPEDGVSQTQPPQV